MSAQLFVNSTSDLESLGCVVAHRLRAIAILNIEEAIEVVVRRARCVIVCATS